MCDPLVLLCVVFLSLSHMDGVPGQGLLVSIPDICLLFYFMVTQKNRLIETALLSTHYICFD